MNFYDEIEEPVREIVRALRDNGINTTCSCGHKMTIQAETIPDGQIKIIHDLLYNYFIEKKVKPAYSITARVEVEEGLLWRYWVDITIGSQFKKEVREEK